MADATDFESSINDPTTPIAIDFDASRNVLLLAFGGLAGRIGFPMFEFNRLTRGLQTTNKIYLRDPYNAWYHRGLPGIGADLEGVASFLKQYTKHPSTRRSIAVGNSGGGYAALLFGHLLGVDEIHAFSPKTFIDPIERLKARDVPPGFQLRDWWWLIRRGERKYFDLKDVLSQSPSCKPTVHVYYSAHHRIDRLHANRIESVGGIHAHAHPHRRHGLIQLMKKSGELAEILERAVQPVE
jgi:hypothetical protein